MGKKVEIVERPVRFRVDVDVEERMPLVDDLAHVEPVKPHEPVGLVEPVLAVELNGAVAWQPFVLVDGEVGAEEHALHGDVSVKRCG